MSRIEKETKSIYLDEFVNIDGIYQFRICIKCTNH